MSDNPIDSLPRFNRVSIRAVLVTEGQDPREALAQAGIFDPVAIPVVPGEKLDLSGGILGDAVTPNLTAVLEPDQEDDWGSSSGLPPNRPSTDPMPRQPEKTTATTLPQAFGPQAFGQRTFAPIPGRPGT